jgi:hypothetical protein
MIAGKPGCLVSQPAKQASPHNIAASRRKVLIGFAENQLRLLWDFFAVGEEFVRGVFLRQSDLAEAHVAQAALVLQTSRLYEFGDPLGIEDIRNSFIAFIAFHQNCSYDASYFSILETAI